MWYNTTWGLDTVADDIWQQAVDLTKKVFAATSGIGLTLDGNWPVVVAVNLNQAHERLDSIFMLLVKGYGDSADVLTRSLFEIAASLSYIAKDVEQRLPRYLRHGNIPLSEEDSEQIRRKLSQEPPPEVKDMVPGRVWKPLRDMCCDLGWLREYDTFYRFVSVVDHAGSFKLGTSYLQLLKQEPPSYWDRSAVLVTALCLYLRVAKVAATLFPTQIKAETIADLSAQCDEMGKFWAKK